MHAQGQTKEIIDSLPGDATLPTSIEELQKLANYDSGDYTYSVEDYFRKPDKSGFLLSPNGKYLSFKQRDKNGKNHVYIKNVESGKTTMVIEEKDQIIATYFWKGNNNILYVQDKGGDENYHLYSKNIETGTDIDLTPFEGVKLSNVFVLTEVPGYVVVPLNKENKKIFEPYKINVNTGVIEKMFSNDDVENSISSYDFDNYGNLRAYSKRKNGTDYSQYYKNVGDSNFNVLVSHDWKTSFNIISFVGPDSDLAYVLTNLNSDKKEIVLYDLKANKIVKSLFKNKAYDLSNISRSKERYYELDYYSYEGVKETTVPVSKFFKKLHRKFKKQFAPNQFKISSKTEDENFYLLYISSDKLYGQYYLYDVKKDNFKLLMDLMPDLDPNEMASISPITFTSRDGLTIHGYLTLPKNATKGHTPLIVNPHGGPYGQRDSWRFNKESQLFASRGYATLQINYRGSGGYGKEFLLAGSKQIGRKMLNDLEDGVKYLIKRGLIDQDKIAIYGASYGGLATLGSLIKSPELYVCGVDYVGVSNFFTFINSFPEYWKPLMTQFYEQWYNPEIPEEKQIMTEVSPALNIDKLNKSLFVIQGANDPRVNIHESDQIVKSLRGKGYEVPYMVKYNEGHGFSHEKNKIELYKTMMGFFAKHLK